MVNITQLPNGVQVASERMPGAYSVSVGLWVGVGSSAESELVNGVSHFFEHMVFKGTENRTALQLAHEIEQRGGSLNAYTTREHTCFYSRVVKEDFSLALDTICDLAMNPLIEASEVEKERKVIVEEIRSYEDSPDELAHDLFSGLHFAGQGLAMPITGTVQSVRRVGRPELMRHHRDLLTKHPIVIVAAGNVDHSDLVGRVRDLLERKRASRLPIPQVKPGTHGGIVLKRKEVQQSTIVAGTSIALRKTGHQRLALTLFNMIFGDGMGSRLFQKVREDHALAYSVFSSVDNFNGCRSFNISLGTDPKRQQKAIELVRGEVLDFLKDGLRTDELERAKTAVLGNIKLGLDSPSTRMNRLARQVIRSGKYTPFSKLQKDLVLVKPNQLMEAVEEVFLQGTWAAAAVIPKDGPKVDMKALLDYK